MPPFRSVAYFPGHIARIRRSYPDKIELDKIRVLFIDSKQFFPTTGPGYREDGAQGRGAARITLQVQILRVQ